PVAASVLSVQPQVAQADAAPDTHPSSDTPSTRTTILFANAIQAVHLPTVIPTADYSLVITANRCGITSQQES
ncbi:MAG: hypothetical protein ACRETD_03900, partial [Steroidobacteraceae bacterium]